MHNEGCHTTTDKGLLRFFFLERIVRMLKVGS